MGDYVNVVMGYSGCYMIGPSGHMIETVLTQSGYRSAIFFVYVLLELEPSGYFKTVSLFERSSLWFA